MKNPRASSSLQQCAEGFSLGGDGAHNTAADPFILWKAAYLPAANKTITPQTQQPDSIISYSPS